MESVAGLVRDYRWFPHRIDERAGNIEFVRLEREQHRAMTFLEDRFLPASVARQVAPLAEVAREAAALPASPLHFLFHSSLALSTLAARLVDQPGAAMGLKEPNILHQVAMLARRGGAVGPLLATILPLLGRPFGRGEAIVVKPSNSANNLIADLLAARPDSRGLILYAPLPDFLGAVARRGASGRVYYRRLFTMLRKDRIFDAGYGPDELFEQTDLQVSAMAWLTQHALFARLCAQSGGRLRTIDTETLLARKVDALEAVVQYFDLALDAGALADSPVFSEHSKELGRRYDAADRRREIDAASGAFAEEIEMVTRWAASVAGLGRIPLNLACPLLGAEARPKPAMGALAGSMPAVASPSSARETGRAEKAR